MNIRPLQPIPDQTIAERLDDIERVLKCSADRKYWWQMAREYLALTTDPEERHEHR